MTRLNTIFPALLIIVSLLGCRQKEVPASLHYTLRGAGDTTLVFVHGWAINSTYWQGQIDHFSNRYRVLAVDLQGHGQSALRDTAITAEKYADDVVSLLTSLQLKNIVLIGHSMSGNINLHVYDKMPNQIIGFIGIDNLQTVGRTPSDEELQQYEGFFRAFRKNYSSLAKQYALSSLFVPETDTLVKARVVNDILSLDSAFSVATLRSVSLQSAAEQRILPAFKIPLMLIVTEGSIKDESSLEKYCGKGYKVWTYRGAGHYPMIEIPEMFNTLLQEALDSI